MDDLISRREAIDGLEGHYIERINLNDWQSGWNAAIDWMKDVYLDELPSAQPGIVRCKDCKYRGGLSGFYCDIVEKAVGVYSFCSWADRRTDETD